MKYIFQIITFVTLLLFLQPSQAQTKSKKAARLLGYVYQTGGNKIPFTYKVLYRTDTAGNYISQYRVYIDGEYKFDVFGTHKKKTSDIKVEVDVAGGGIFAAVAEAQKVTYKSTTLEPFGFEGVGSVLGGNQVPSQLAVRFVSNSFTYIKVINVLGYHGGDGADYFVFK
jgi:hypothetical protein